ncbi:MAG TPA: hypothetical protein VH482_28340 [Thermomicrobiales bacterium]|jgi:hypothetical protein
MVHAWLARPIAAILVAAVWCGAPPALARTVDGQFSIVVDAEGIPNLADTAPAGSTLVTLDNQTALSFGASLYFVPEATVAEILGATPVATGTGDVGADGLPAWLDGATPVGGPGIAGPDGRTEAVVDLLPGNYALVFNVFAPDSATLTPVVLTYDDGSPFFITVSERPEPTPPPARTATPAPSPTRSTIPATPKTGEPPGSTMTAEPTSEDSQEEPTALPDVADVTATVVMTDDAFVLPDSFRAGPQIWDVVNQGQLTHALIVVSVPPGTTADQLRAALFPTAGETAQAAAETAFDASAMTNVGGLGPLAPGLSAAAALDLPAGYYAAFSALPDPLTGEPDGAQGLLAVFFVG